jgi:hypothetical protein
MARRHGRIDANQREIVAALRAAGATVQSLADVGRGCPDLLVGYRGVNYVLEIKDGDKPKSAQRLTVAEVHWHYTWRGSVVTVNNAKGALHAIGAPVDLDESEEAA